jgi:hypothetical protein
MIFMFVNVNVAYSIKILFAADDKRRALMMTYILPTNISLLPLLSSFSPSPPSLSIPPLSLYTSIYPPLKYRLSCDALGRYRRQSRHPRLRQNDRQGVEQSG